MQERDCLGPGDPGFEAAMASGGLQPVGGMTLMAVLLCTLVRGGQAAGGKGALSGLSCLLSSMGSCWRLSPYLS